MTEQTAINVVERAIQNAESGGSVSSYALSIKGMTSPKIRTLLNTLCGGIKTYLEVGLYRGATFISAIEANKGLTAVGCDNWSQFGGPRSDFERNLAGCIPGAKVTIHDKDYRSAEFQNWLLKQKPFDAFFFDGPHDFDSQQSAVTLYEKIMPEVGILIVDDWWKWGRTPTLRAVEQSKAFDLVKYWPLREGYWEGVGVLVLKRR